MSDRRAEAFAELLEWEAEATETVGYGTPAHRDLRVIAALRSVLERHRPYIQRTSRGPLTRWCLACNKEPCPDETAVIDALLGPEAPPTEGTAP